MSATPNEITRRDFLKLGGLSLLSLLLPDLPTASTMLPGLAGHTVPASFGRAGAAPPAELLPDQQGRVTERLLWTYEQPTVDSPRVKMHWRDLVLPISGLTVSDDETAYNRVWYRIGDEGYAYSGALQPVRTILNQPITEAPAEGLLGEVTVPYTDALEQPGAGSRFAQRLYYETTHWILSVEVNPADGSTWYKLLDDKWLEFYYAPAEHLRVIPDEELSPLSPDVPNKEKLIEVRLEEQLVIAYEAGRVVHAARAATGAKFRDGSYSTPSGNFVTFHKRPTRHMAAGDIASNGFDLPGVPWVLYITDNGISFHGTYWHNDYGRPRSHGCINLTPHSAKWLYRWTLPQVAPGERYAYESYGTKVLIVE